MYASIWILLAMIASHVVSSQGDCKSSDHLCNGVCVPEKYICDGSSDCEDGSDESTDLCQFRPCRSEFGMLTSFFMFRCTYGACISIEFKCNGISDCIDSSDETGEQCFQQFCTKNKFRCAYGACISKSNRCNGIVDCFDGSDEKEELCVGLRRSCGRGYFRCDYGACIYHRKKCDGRLDCADGSDESVSTCGQKNILLNFNSTSVTAIMNTSLLTTTSAPTIRTTSLTSSIKSATYTSPTSTFSTSPASKTTLSPFITVVTDVYINYSLNDSLFIVNDSVVAENVSNISDGIEIFETNDTITTPILFSGSIQELHLPHPPPCSPEECLCPLLNEICISCPRDGNLQDVCNQFDEKEIFCSISRNEDVQIDIISCGEQKSFMNIPHHFLRSFYKDCQNEDKMPVNTVAFVDCWGKSSELYSCKEDGKWYLNNAIHDDKLHFNDATKDARWHPNDSTMDIHSKTELCQVSNLNPKVCGTLPRGKVNSTRLRWPFLVAVFEDDLFLCSGTLIASQWVLTDAFCLYKYQKIRSSMEIDIRIKNISLKIQHALWYNGSSMPRISDVFLHPNYSSTFSTKFKKDLALLKLEVPLTQSENLVPICLDCSKGNIHSFASSAATFLHEETHEGVKWKVEAKTVSENCSNLEREFPHRLEEDQFCANSLDSYAEATHDKPTDGPYLVNSGPEHKEKWILLGVFSYSISVDKGQTKYVYTSVCKNIDWIKSCINKNRCL